jgi:hypothetical protein
MDPAEISEEIGHYRRGIEAQVPLHRSGEAGEVAEIKILYTCKCTCNAHTSGGRNDTAQHRQMPGYQAFNPG